MITLTSCFQLFRSEIPFASIRKYLYKHNLVSFLHFVLLCTIAAMITKLSRNARFSTQQHLIKRIAERIYIW